MVRSRFLRFPLPGLHRAGCAVCIAVLAAGPGRLAAQAGVSRPRSLSEDLQLFSQVLNHIRLNHPDSVDLHELVLAAIQGMVEAADPHSWVIPAVRLDPETEEALREGRYVPLPVRFEFVGGTPLVTSVAPGTTAYRADIHPGDALLEVDGQPVTAENAEELSLALSGPEGSVLNLTLERWTLDGSRRVFTRAVRREKAGGGTAVPGAALLEDRVGYVRITTFDNAKVADDLRDRLDHLKAGGMAGLILDLRDNAGGFLDQAAEAAGVFLPRGTVVYTAEGRKASVTDTVRVSRSLLRREDQYPVAVLVNEGTASAAELVAAALQDHDRGVIVGRPTFGKALMISPFIMSDGSVLMLVVGRIRTPCGRVIQRPYRGVSLLRYQALAGLDPDTSQLPKCRSAGGRTLYGGGGVHPDRLLEVTPPPPAWRIRSEDSGLLSRWAGSFVDGPGAAAGSVQALLEDDVLIGEAVRTFRSRASSEGVDVESASDQDLKAYVLPELARVRWGVAQAVEVSAALDPAVSEAARVLLEALGNRRP